MAGDLETAYQTAIAKAAVDGKGLPSERSMSALSTWAVNRRSAALYNAQAMADFVAGYSPTSAGGASYATPGTYSFTVPTYNTLTAYVSGAGSGGGGLYSAGGNGGLSAFGSVVAYGATGGSPSSTAPTNGSPGAASGGTTNATGGGAPGGTGSVDTYSDKSGSYTSRGGDGAAGGYASQVYPFGALTPGTVVTVTVGAPGGPGFGASATMPTSGLGGSVSISWT